MRFTTVSRQSHQQYHALSRLDLEPLGWGVCHTSSLEEVPGSTPPAALPHGALHTRRGRGILAEEEERLFRLRQEKEGEARARLLEEKNKLEEESRQSMVRSEGEGQGSLSAQHHV